MSEEIPTPEPPPVPEGAMPVPLPPQPFDFKYANERPAKNHDAVVFKDACEVVRAGKVTFRRDSSSPMVVVEFLTAGGKGFDTVDVRTLTHVEDAHAALQK